MYSFTMPKHCRSESPSTDTCDMRDPKQPRERSPTPELPTLRNLSVGDLRQILTVWNLNVEPSKQRHAAIKQVGTILFSGRQRLANQRQRQQSIWMHIIQRLIQLLFVYGYSMFICTTQDSAPQLHISSHTPNTTTKLPTWLEIAYIKIVDSYISEYITEHADPDKAIRPGDRIVDHSSTWGTNGTIGNELYALTVGHFVNDSPGSIFEIEHLFIERKISANHLNLRYPDRKNKLAIEVGILRVKQEDLSKFDAYLKRVDVYKLVGKEPPKKVDLEKEKARGFAIAHVIEEKSGIRVYKEGRKTGKTFGILDRAIVIMNDAPGSAFEIEH